MNKKELIAYQLALPKIDTHEHISPEQYILNSNVDIFDILLIPYNCDTLQSAGCTRDEWKALMNQSWDFSKRYQILEKYIPLVRYTAFFQAALRTLRLSFGEQDMTLDALWRANQQLQEKLRRPHYEEELGRLNIKQVLSCSGYDCAAIYGRNMVRFIPTVSEILPRNHRDMARLQKASGVRVYDLNSCLNAISVLFAGYQKAGVPAVKFGSAYRRTLAFGTPDFQKAEAQLQHVLNSRLMGDAKNNGSLEPCCCYEELVELDDYLTDYMLSLCSKYQLPVIFHTAMHAWNENDPERAHSHYLTSLIQKYSDVNFILLHAGAPFFEEAVLLSRYYPNVYLDLTWFHIISPRLVRQAILRILELVPINKVFAFGGDYCYLHTLPGHLDMAMENFAEAFLMAMEDGVLDEAAAKEILRKWYFENPLRVFKIEMKH